MKEDHSRRSPNPTQVAKAHPDLAQVVKRAPASRKRQGYIGLLAADQNL